jgi:hypothetical protein
LKMWGSRSTRRRFSCITAAPLKIMGVNSTWAPTRTTWS